MNERFLEHLKARATELAADYPFSVDADEWECLYAITASLEGTNLANDDLHRILKDAGTLIRQLCRKLPPDDKVRVGALDWLVRHHLQGSVLRDDIIPA